MAHLKQKQKGRHIKFSTYLQVRLRMAVIVVVASMLPFYSIELTVLQFIERGAITAPPPPVRANLAKFRRFGKIGKCLAFV